MSVSQRTEATATPRPGVYTPLPTFFYEDEELNLVEYRKHLLHVVGRGAREAVHLSREERSTLIRCTRETLDEQGFESVPVVAGVGGLSTRETIQLAKDAFEAGATVGMVIPPAYYAATLQQDSAQIEQYYVDICKESPVTPFVADCFAEFALAYLYGYGKNPRKPLLSLDEENRDLVVGLLNPLLALEKRYENTVLCS
ncbi:hypothetical protein E4T43_02893 [Aureobasidium subglaciale]|nr:hypothetical protein E4T43_02893 [Aureobasidium subglaciale]